MRNMIRKVTLAATAALLLAVPTWAQNKWEIGGSVGGGIHLNKQLTGGTSSATTGFQPGIGAAIFIGNDYRTRYGGEIRYGFQRNPAKLSAGSTNLNFGANSHQLTYDFLIYPGSNRSKVRPFILAGGGLRGYQGTGKEQALQPLLQYAALTKSNQWLPMINFGGGVKWDLSDRVVLRFEVRDSVSQFPDNVILPVPPYKKPGMIHNIMPSIGISYRFE